MDEGLARGTGQEPLALGGRHLDEIAEHVVVLDLERADAGLLGIARLQTDDHVAGVVAQLARGIEVRDR